MNTNALVGQLVEHRYRIEAEIGRGATGMVFRARHVRVGREVAIKVLHPHLMRDASMVERFDREAAIVARLHHKNLVNVIDVGETDHEQRFMVLDLVRGPSLAALITHCSLDRARVIHLTMQILAGLDHAHGAGLVHRDLKPENVIVERDNFNVETPRIVDFGIALLRDRSTTETKRLAAVGTIFGTPAYMAPEQAQGGEPDPRTDLFALGVMVYEMLTGKQPFDGSSMEIVLANMTMDPPRMAARANVEVDPALEAFARKLMSRDLRDRYYSAHEAMQALAAIEQGRPRLANGTGAPASIARPTIPTGERPLARTIARLRKRAEEERAATVALAAQPPRGRQAIWAGIVLAIGALIGWHLARQPRVEAAFHATPKVVTTDEALR